MEKCVSLNDLKHNRFNGVLNYTTIDCFSRVSDLYLKILGSDRVTLYDWKDVYHKLVNEIIKARSDGDAATKSYLSKLATTNMYLRDLILEKNNKTCFENNVNTICLYYYQLTMNYPKLIIDKKIYNVAILPTGTFVYDDRAKSFDKLNNLLYQYSIQIIINDDVYYVKQFNEDSLIVYVD